MTEKLPTPSAEALNATVEQARQSTQEAGMHDDQTAFKGREYTEFMGSDRMNDPRLKVTDSGVMESVTANISRGNKDYKAIAVTDKSISGTRGDYHNVRITTHNEDGTTTQRESSNPYLARKLAKSIGDRVISQAVEQASREADKAA